MDELIRKTVEDAAIKAEENRPPWRGADLPRGYADITSEIDLTQCDVLNAADDTGLPKDLFSKDKPSTLEQTSGSAQGSKKDWLESGSDDQLLLYVPFHAMLKLHTIQLTSLPPADDPDAPMRPATLHLYTNRPHNLDFSEADDTPPEQAVTLKASDWNGKGTANVALHYVKFQQIISLVIYVTRGDGDGRTVRLDRVRLVGDAGEKVKKPIIDNSKN